MTDEELQSWVERVSLEFFGEPFRHRATFNGRLTTTGGRYFTATHNIDISKRQLAEFGVHETEKIIKHELCHYHLHIKGMGYRHRDADFKKLLQAVGGSRFCKSIPGVKKVEPYRYKLECLKCRAEYLRKRRVDTRKFRCGKCHGRLEMRAL